jgi:hypothetical protein
MSTHSESAPRPLPERPSLRHLKDQAKDLLKAQRCAVQDRSDVWFCELAQVEATRGFT